MRRQLEACRDSQAEAAFCSVRVSTKRQLLSICATMSTIQDNFFSPRNHEFYASFRYPPLDAAQKEIRLLRIKPGKAQSDDYDTHLLSGISLLDKPSYFALSYHAGDPENTKVLRINGHEFNAFTNLALALGRTVKFWLATFPDQCELLLWVDQICINQSDLEERTSQVNLMRDIYAGAEHTAVCLQHSRTEIPFGLEDLASTVLTECLSAAESTTWLLSYFPDLKYRNPKKESLHFSRLYSDYGDTSTSDFDKLIPFLLVLTYITAIVTSQWWRRVWIAQEYLTSTHTWFLVGDSTFTQPQMLKLLLSDTLHVDILTFHDAVLSTYDVHPQPRFFPFFSWIMYDLVGSMKSYQWKCVQSLLSAKVEWRGEQHLSAMLALTSLRHCADPRDRIFATLGLVSKSHGIKADYSSSTKEEILLITTAKSILDTERDLRTLVHAVTSATWHADQLDIPSWVSSWTRGHPGESFIELDYVVKHITEQNFTPSLWLTTDFGFVQLNPDDELGKVLVTTACQVAVVNRIEGSDLSTHIFWHKKVNGSSQMGNFYPIYCTSQPGFEADHAVSISLSRANFQVIPQTGDQIWIIAGANIPFLLRPQGTRHVLLDAVELRERPTQDTASMDPWDWAFSPVMYGHYDRALSKPTTIYIK